MKSRPTAIMTFVGLMVWIIFSPITVQAQGHTLHSAKAAGFIGERPDGYVGMVRSDVPDEIKSLVRQTNARRLAEYQSIAQRNRTSVQNVQIIAGAKLIGSTPPGWFVMDASGRWKKK